MAGEARGQDTLIDTPVSNIEKLAEARRSEFKNLLAAIPGRPLRTCGPGDLGVVIKVTSRAKMALTGILDPLPHVPGAP
jgi:hypothetical protein